MQIIYELIAIMFEGGFSVEEIKNHMLEVSLECDDQCVKECLQDYINNLQEDTKWMTAPKKTSIKTSLARSQY